MLPCCRQWRNRVPPSFSYDFLSEEKGKTSQRGCLISFSLWGKGENFTKWLLYITSFLSEQKGQTLLRDCLSLKLWLLVQLTKWWRPTCELQPGHLRIAALLLEDCHPAGNPLQYSNFLLSGSLKLDKRIVWAWNPDCDPTLGKGSKTPVTEKFR